MGLHANAQLLSTVRPMSSLPSPAGMPDVSSLRSRFSLNSDARVDTIHIDAIDDAIVVIDDFFRFPDLVVDLANELDFLGSRRTSQFKRHIGERARISISQHVAMDRLYEGLPGRKLPRHRYHDYETVFTRFNLKHIDEMDVRQFVPHIDNDSAFSVLVYLHEQGDSAGGTYLYRHRETGLAKLPRHPDATVLPMMKERGLRPAQRGSYVEFIKALMYSDLQVMDAFPGYTGIPESTQTWEVVHRIRAKFNRLVVFPALAFHSPVIRASDHQHESRLTQNIFFMPR